ncbi:transmembrane and TPR repeat-containing protein F38B6.6 [Geobacter sp. OR-1]|uniref:tetratricopeptide repeat protein n=1 Tax=Geobacter sp. OR-1 TaxID=1266765 RepID=UPI000541B25F|nr:tetratricopeptide repeat protein [Geobacter sp. OR-1]GAM08030.1 transmembrane and TPR repeat-containing protein F38B6.6 [Geobacter sp. OR-1]
MTVPQKHAVFRFGFLIILIAALYGSTLSHGFVWDDAFIIVNNPLLEKLSNIPQFFLSEDTIEDSTGYYRPVTYISFALDRAVWGGNPTGYHITNLVLHMVAVLLFYAVTAALFKKECLALVAALIFALHPMAGETVNFLSGGRNTLLSASFALLSLLFYIKNYRIPAVACFAVAIFSKEFALLLPMVFLVYDCRILREKIRFSRYIPYMIPVTIYLILRSVAVQKANFLAGIGISNIITAPYLVVRYALNMIVPAQLKVLYNVQPGMVAGILCSVVIVVVIGAVIAFRKHAELVFSAIWFILFLLPVINIIPIHSTTMMADRYAYFSLMGFALCLAFIICRFNGKGVAVGIVTLCTLYAFVGFSRNSIWKSEIGFFTRMTKDAPDTFVGFRNLGLSYYKQGQIAQAVANLEAADSKPDIATKYLIGDSYIFWKENMPGKAEKPLFKVMEREPLNPEPYLVLMMMDEQYGNIKRAHSYRDKLNEMGHGIDKILADRTVELCRAGETYLSRRQFVDAEIFFWQSLKINPDYIPALIDMGSLKAEQGDYANAMAYLNKVLAIDPLNSTAHFNLSALYRMQGRFSDAQNEMIKFRDSEAVAQHKKGSISSSSPTAGGHQ